MSGGKAARNAASIVNRQTCGGVKKGGLMGGIGSIGTGGMSSSQRRLFCGKTGTCSKEMNSVFRMTCSGNYTNPSQSTYRRAVRGLF